MLPYKAAPLPPLNTEYISRMMEQKKAQELDHLAMVKKEAAKAHQVKQVLRPEGEKTRQQ